LILLLKWKVASSLKTSRAATSFCRLLRASLWRSRQKVSLVFVVWFQNMCQLVNFQNQTLPDNLQTHFWGKCSSRLHLEMDFGGLCWKASDVLHGFICDAKTADFPPCRCPLWLQTAHTSHKSTLVGVDPFGNVY
jgi:hypothetical protein